MLQNELSPGNFIFFHTLDNYYNFVVVFSTRDVPGSTLVACYECLIFV